VDDEAGNDFLVALVALRESENDLADIIKLFSSQSTNLLCTTDQLDVGLPALFPAKPIKVSH
jgi:hypothetical protein